VVLGVVIETSFLPFAVHSQRANVCVRTATGTRAADGFGSGAITP
jgi:hypothetical protein